MQKRRHEGEEGDDGHKHKSKKVSTEFLSMSDSLFFCVTLFWSIVLTCVAMALQHKHSSKVEGQTLLIKNGK